MRNTFLSCTFLLFSTVAFAQPNAGANSRLLIDLDTVNLGAAGITRFELKDGAGNWSSIGLPPSISDPGTPINMTTFGHPLTTFSAGLHTVQVRACNISVCGDPSPNFTFRMLVTPAVPSLRLSPGIAVAGIINRNPYLLGNTSVIDVLIPEYGVTLNFGSPTWTIPNVYSAKVGDSVLLSLNSK